MTAIRRIWLRASSSTVSIPAGTRSGRLSDRGQPQAGRVLRGEAREEPGHVGLVAGPPPAQHVGVDHYERRRHAAASR